ncbi:MAG: helix-hairpin-helix domain-containing protein [Bacteroidota bacterium]
MKTKKIEQFVKEYFYFSQSERKGIIALLLLLIAVMAFPSVYKIVVPPLPLEVSIESLHGLNSQQSVRSERQSTPDLFDPNTASSTQLKSLGFTDRNIVSLQKFVSKGGRFKKPEDLRNMYGVKKELIETLIPFVHINPTVGKPPFVKDSSQHKFKNTKPVELNAADTSALIALYRIGPGMARRIVEYREKLGGFLSLAQLTEIYGFDEDVLYDLQGKIYVDAGKARIFDVNTVSLDELKTHPYFKYKLSNAIVNYRTQHGAYRELSDLKKIVIVNDSIYQNITKYLKIK